MYFTFSSRFSCWWHNHVVEKYLDHRAAHKKTYYWCRVCKQLYAPYFEDNNISKYHPKTCGWGKVDRHSWICHQCLDHGFDTESNRKDNRYLEPTWDEWKKYIDQENTRILTLIKNKDPKFYEDNELEVFSNSYSSYYFNNPDYIYHTEETNEK